MADEIRNKVNLTVGRAYQQFLNSKLPTWHLPLVVDGYCGKMTTAATYQVFQNKNALAATDDKIAAVAKLLGEPNTTRIRTVAAVESNGSGWDRFGFPSVLYEPHYFWRETGGRVGVTGFSNPSRPKQYTIDANRNDINDSWENLAAASWFDARAAFQSISMSKFQIMGKWHSQLGFKEPWEMAYAVAVDENIHYELLAKWILHNNQIKALKAINGTSANCVAFARFWNGSGYASGQYHIKLANAYLRLSKIYGL